MITVYRLDGTDQVPVAEYEDDEWVEGAEEMELIFGSDPPTQDELLESLDGPQYFASLPEETEKGIEEADHRDPEDVLNDPDEPATNTLALKEDGDRVYVDSVHDAPPDKLVHSDDTGLFYHDEVDNPEPTEPEGVKSWVPYTGPQGGSGWRNTDTEEVVYDDEPPGEVVDPRGSTEGDRGNDPSTSGFDRVPGNAVPMDDVMDVPDDAITVRGSDGGLHYVEDGDMTPDVESVADDMEEDHGIEANLTGYTQDKAEYLSERLSENTSAVESINRVESNKANLEISPGLSDAAFDPSDGTLFIHPREFDEDRQKEREELAEAGEVEYESLEGMIEHEFGHAAHHANLDEEDRSVFGLREGIEVMRENADTIREDMSNYAMSNEQEFVAEVYSRLRTGGEVEPETREAYDAFLGPEVEP